MDGKAERKELRLKQVYRALLSAIPVLALMLVFEIVFELPPVVEALSSFVTSGHNDVIVYLIVFFLMYLQGTILPIPAYIPLNAAVSIGLVDTSLGIFGIWGQGSTWILFGVVIAAYMLGVATAYLLGYFLGSKAVKWIASSEEEYDKWKALLDGKGKWFYFLTVLLPVFPDDILCLVCGSLRMNFGAFFLSNLVGRSIGLVFMMSALTVIKNVSAGFPWAAVAWALALVAAIAGTLVLKFRKPRSSSDGGND